MLISLIAFTYLGLLFAIAYYGDSAAARGRSLIANPYVYALTLALYVSGASFFGAAGRAATFGFDFLPIYLGPTLAATLLWPVLRKIIRIAKTNHITSLADFMSSRHGKSGRLAGLVAIIAACGAIPYMALQLKAISTGYGFMAGYPDLLAAAQGGPAPVHADTTFYVALLLAVFTIMFGTRHLDTSERHEGLVAAIAFESVVKLAAFVALGLCVVYAIHDGFADLFAKAAQLPQAASLTRIAGTPAGASTAGWPTLAAWSGLFMLGCFFAPRLFQLAVVENINESHLVKAAWLFPLYMLLFSLFILPIALGGLLHFAGQPIHPDTFIFALPLSEGWRGLALLVFVGGLSASSSMVIVEAIALSTMVCNDLVMPVLLRFRQLKLSERADLSGLLLAIRRIIIVLIVLLAYVFFRLAGSSYTLQSTGFISMVTAANFAVVLLAGIYWKGATRAGALAGLAAGFLVWSYTLVVPGFVHAGWLPASLLEQGPAGIGLLRPANLFGLDGLDPLTHGLLWSLLANACVFFGVSAFTGQSPLEQTQADLFVNVFEQEDAPAYTWRAKGSVRDLHALLSRFLGQHRATALFSDVAKQRQLDWPDKVDAELVSIAESRLAGVVGAASARAMIASVIDKESLRDQVTGLPNQAAMVDTISAAQAQARRQKDDRFALLSLSLDRFHVITQSLGASAGDQLLAQVARRLNDDLEPGETAARVGDDRFAILIRSPRGMRDVLGFTERLQADLGSAYRLDNHEVYTTASIGIIPDGAASGDAAGLLRDAETANHRAVARGGACVEVFEPGLRDRALALFDMETMLRQAALSGDNFEVHYQPIVRLDTGRLAGFEALVRMRRADGSLVPPGDFIPLTEETGLIIRIGHWVLAEACRQMRAWQLKYPDSQPLQISINLAGRQFRQPQLVQEIEQVLTETDLDVASLKLEVTETVVMEQAEEAADALGRLHRRGVKLLIDDFGTGYSSLSYLRRFPVNTLKIDASFVRRMDTSREDAGIVHTIVALAHMLNMDIVAEGIETARQFAQLRELQVEFGQGFYFARPLDAVAAEAVIAEPVCWGAESVR